ncbi:hypothetical protein ACIBG7_18715 [Nonomuraea sp. NPDC050328]|uniref:hypothetical protein n=1 Tax=Nonomuraea sp. NPDC050328 TaxID=3364361 RepID=UPI00379DD71F
MSPQTALLEQPTLWDDNPTPTSPTPPKPASRPRNHTLGLPKPPTTHCMTICLVCGRPEDLGTCETGCATVCSRPTTRTPVEICITRTRTDAEIVFSPTTADMHLLVRDCPHCHNPHRHAPQDHPWRTAPCGRPYLLNIKEPQT